MNNLLKEYIGIKQFIIPRLLIQTIYKYCSYNKRILISDLTVDFLTEINK